MIAMCKAQVLQTAPPRCGRSPHIKSSCFHRRDATHYQMGHVNHWAPGSFQASYSHALQRQVTAEQQPHHQRGEADEPGRRRALAAAARAGVREGGEEEEREEDEVAVELQPRGGECDDERREARRQREQGERLPKHLGVVRRRVALAQRVEEEARRAQRAARQRRQPDVALKEVAPVDPEAAAGLRDAGASWGAGWGARGCALEGGGARRRPRRLEEVPPGGRRGGESRGVGVSRPPWRRAGAARASAACGRCSPSAP